MHRDKKLGLALGVLLIGIVGAFFFRLDHKKKDRVPQLNNPQALDRQMADKPGSPYAGDGAKNNAGGAQNQKKEVEPPLWQASEFLADGKIDMPEDWLAENPAAPDPIRAETIHEELADNEMFDDSADDELPIARTVSQSKPKNQTTESENYAIHQVRNGDTLSGLASQYLGSSARFNEIYTLNREVLADPNNLTVGTELRIPKRVQAAQQPKTNSLFHNADNRHRIDAKNASTGKILPPSAPAGGPKGKNTTETRNSLPRRFVPVSRPPFAPGRRENQSSENGKPTLKQTLSQIPPADLPDID